MSPLFTLGHSTLTEPEFVQAARGIDVIVDVRSHPGSRHVPQFNQEAMREWLPRYGLSYEWWPELGGWSEVHCHDETLRQRMAAVGVDIAAYGHGQFPKHHIGVDRPAGQLNPTEGGGEAPSGEEAPKPVWTNVGLHEYSWYMSLPGFLDAADHLIAQFGARSGPRAAMICAESLHWKCHRSMIADYLHFRGVPCYHLPVKPPKRPTTRRYKAHAEALGNRLERYPLEVIAVWASWNALRDDAQPAQLTQRQPVATLGL